MAESNHSQEPEQSLILVLMQFLHLQPLAENYLLAVDTHMEKETGMGARLRHQLTAGDRSTGMERDMAKRKEPLRRMQQK